MYKDRALFATFDIIESKGYSKYFLRPRKVHLKINCAFQIQS